MSKNILFISEQKLKDTTFLSDNVDPKQLLPTVKAAQDRYVHTLLGTALYTRLQNDVTANTVAGDYKILLDDYLTDVLIWYTLSEIPMPLLFKMLNKGVVTRTGETMQVTSTTDALSMVKWCRDWAEWYAQRAADYLCANSEKYPEYINPGSSADTIMPDTTQYTSGLFLGCTRPDTRTFEEKYQGNIYRKP